MAEPSEIVKADDTVTAGGSWPTAVPTDGRTDGSSDRPADQPVDQPRAAEPNGWFAGPHAEPDRFELLGSGLAGGEGNTWRARYRGELTAPLTIAVKELRRPTHAPPDWPTPSDVQRWEDQRALLQYMRIDHLVTVIDIFVGAPPHLPGPGGRRTPDTPYIVMDWVPGPTLADQLSGTGATPCSLAERLTYVQHVAEALHALHSRTVSAGNPTLHRDVKPTNCILDPKRGVVLVDVGAMRRMDDGYDEDGLHTPAYTAPEVLANPRSARTASSDLYSLGALAYFCLLGEDPPRPDQPGSEAKIEALLWAAARSAEVADVDGFVAQLRLMLDPDPAQRPADAMAWARRLRSFASRRGPRRPLGQRVSAAKLYTLVTAVVVVLGIVTFATVHGLGVGSPAGEPSARTRAAVDYGPPPGPPPPGPPPPTAGYLPLTAKFSQKPVQTRFAMITSPQNGVPVRLCATITGTSKLPAGQTLLLSVENLNAGDGVRHLRTVDGWQRPATLNRWRGVLFIGLPEDPVGWHYLVEVFVVPLATLSKEITDAASLGRHWDMTLPASSVVGASVIVSRAMTPDRLC